MADPLIKPDPDTKGASPGAFADDDIYEDAGDLEFNQNPAWQQLYLARVPKDLWKAWSYLDDDAEIQLGTIRMTKGGIKPDGSLDQKLSMLLRPDLAAHQGIAKEYNLDVEDNEPRGPRDPSDTRQTKNTFVFTEQDLPGFKSKARQKFEAATANMPARLTRPKPDKNKAPYDPNKKFTPFVRKAVPKRTVLAGRVKHEINAVEVDNEESRRLLELRTLESMKPKKTTKFLGKDSSELGEGLILPGTMGAMKTFNTFIKTKGSGAGGRPQINKAARIPQNELLDKIFACFRRYNYWSMKALRAELQQPEAYLRETLEKVAILAKSGRFATQWSLKPENKLSEYVEGETVAPAGEIEDEDEDTNMDDEDDDDDEDMKFEDVGMS